MFASAELDLTIDAIPDADDLAAFIARAVELGLMVTAAAPTAREGLDGRYVVTVSTGPDRDAEEVFKAFSKLMTAAESIKG